MEVQVKLTPKVLFRAIRSVADSIGRNCEARMMDEVIAASAEDGAGIPANVELRDYFAGKAMQGLLSCPYPVSELGYQMKNNKSLMENSAIFSYELADAMLAARGAA